MAKEIIMPRFGMTQEEATIVRWLVKEGAHVEYGDPICEVTTDKVNMEVEAPASGILAGLRYGEGETVPVTEIIGYILAEGEALPAAGKAGKLEETPTSTEPQPVRVAATPISATPVARRIAAEQQIPLDAVRGSGPQGRVTRKDVERYLSESQMAELASRSGKIRATPAARRLARQTQIELSQISGSGAQGRVQGVDVAAAARGEQVSHEKPERIRFEPIGGVKQEQPAVIKLEGMRRTIAQRMQASWQTIPHIMFTIDIDMERAIAMRESFNARYKGEGPGVSMTAVLVKACAAALRQHPRLNAYLREDQILIMPEINIGMAVALEEGLIVPVVRQADYKSLYQIGQEVADLTKRARAGNLKPEDVVDGTFTLSNLGMFGVDHFTAIINPPQVAILATGRVARRYVLDDLGNATWRQMMTVTLSVDHRAVDGAAAAGFLATLRGILETAGAQWG